MKWFKMDCDAQDNLDMVKLVDEWGWDWYGRYYAILGKIGMLVTKHCQTFALQTNNGSPFPVKLLANDLGTNVERLTNFLNYLSDNHLIDKTAWKQKGLIFCPKLKDRADEYTNKLPTKSRHSPDQEVEVDIEVDKKEKKTGDSKQPESLVDVAKLFAERNYQNAETEAEAFWNYYESNGWRVGKNPMKNWKAAAANWNKNAKQYRGSNGTNRNAGSQYARATFKHDDKSIQRLKDLQATLEQRDRERNERTGTN